MRGINQRSTVLSGDNYFSSSFFFYYTVQNKIENGQTSARSGMRVQMHNCKILYFVDSTNCITLCRIIEYDFQAHFGKFPNSIAMKWIETSNDTEVETDVYSEREAFFEFMLPMLGFFFALTFIFYFLHSYTSSGQQI